MRLSLNFNFSAPCLSSKVKSTQEKNVVLNVSSQFKSERTLVVSRNEIWNVFFCRGEIEICVCVQRWGRNHRCDYDLHENTDTDYRERVETLCDVKHILRLLSRSYLYVWTDLSEKQHKKYKRKRICVQNNEVNVWMDPVWPPADGWCSPVITSWMHESPFLSFFYRILRSADSLSRSNSFNLWTPLSEPVMCPRSEWDQYQLHDSPAEPGTNKSSYQAVSVTCCPPGAARLTTHC